MKEEIYMDQTPRFMQNGTLVCRLKKFPYCMKQAPCTWYQKIDRLFLCNGFKRCESNHSICVNIENGKILLVILYVDGLIITNSCKDYK
jgi:hypothetical protein